MKKSLKTLIMFMAVAFGVLLATGTTSKADVQSITLQQTGATTSKAELSWTMALGSSPRYSIMCSRDNTTWVEQNYTYSTTYSLTNLSAGDNVYVRIDAYNNYTKSELIGQSNVIQVSVLPEVARVEGLTQTGATSTSITMKWNAVANATNYEVYRYNSYNDYTKLGDTTSTEYTVNGLAESTSFSYFVIAQQVTAAGYTGSSSEYQRQTMKTAPSKTLNLQMTNYWENLSEASVGWSEVSNADGYQFQYQNYKGKNLMNTHTTSRSIYVRPFKKGIFTKMRVRAYIEVNGQKVYGAWSDYKYYATASKITVKRSANKKKITLNWKKITGAAGYRVYISTKKDSGYKKVKSLSAKKTKYTITKYGKKKLSKNKTYYIRLVYTYKSGKKTITGDVMRTFSV